MEKGVGAQRQLEVCVREVHEIATQADWVAGGGHRPWIDELLQSAEQIVWLDLSWNIARWRLVTRYLRASLAGSNNHRGLLKLYHFMRHAKVFYTSTQPDPGTRLMEAEELQPYRQKLVHCRRPPDVEALCLRLMAFTE